MTDAIERARTAHAFAWWAYVLMPNHVHLLIHPRSDVPPILKSIKQSVARRAVAWVKENDPDSLHTMADPRPNGRVVHRFWRRGGGYDRNLWEPVHIWEAIDDFHLNPVRAGLVEHPCEWAWSSFGCFQGGKAPPLATDQDGLPGRP